ncbi:MAG: type II toxin-antitoxin system PemK/MazF family toxin [Nanoarchaeota archaeon]
MEQVLVKQRDIILVPFPFSDQSGHKIRPALVLSNDVFNGGRDVITCGITGNVKPSQYSIIIDQKNIDTGTLHDRSAIKVESVAKIDRTLIIKQIARIDTDTFSRAVHILQEIVKAKT